MKRRIFRVILCILLLLVAADTGYIIYHRATEKPAAAPTPTQKLSGRERLDAMMGDDTPANAESNAATEELRRTGKVTYHGETYTMPWYRAVKEWVWDALPDIRGIFGMSRK